MKSADDRVRALFAIARRARTPGDPLHTELRAALVRGSGLAEAGVDLALDHHLETDLTERDRAKLHASVTSAPTCHVVLSAHVCTAALRALVLATMTSPRVVVRPSRRDPFLAELLVREGARAGLDLTLAPPRSSDDETAHAAQPGDEVHAYGGREALLAIERALPAGVHLRPHGPGFGVAVVLDGDLAEAAERLTDDVVPFDQRGCLSPRVALVRGDALAFARALDAALGRRAALVPRGPLIGDEAPALALFVETSRALGTALIGPAHAVAHDPAPEGLLLPPPARALLVLDLRHAAVLAPALTSVTSVGVHATAPDEAADDLAARGLTLPRGVRVTRLGTMQRPPLDGPVDGRTTSRTHRSLTR